MGEVVQLGSHGGLDGRVIMPGIGHRNAGRKIDIAAAVRVPYLGIAGACRKDRVHHAETARNGGLTAFPERFVVHSRVPPD